MRNFSFYAKLEPHRINSGVQILTTELTNEQIVTNLLISNEFLKPVSGYNCGNRMSDLGKYLTNEFEKEKELQRKSRYSFIDVNSGWDNSFRS